MSDNTSVSAGLSAMFEAAKSGGDLRTAFNAPESVTSPELSAEKEESSSTEQENKTEPVQAVEAESSLDSPTTEPEAKVEGDIEEITFTDHKGRRTVKVDFSDKDKVRKLASLAYGSRKFQVERDNFKQELAKEREDNQKLKTDMAKFESVYDKQGLKGLVLMLEGQEGLDKLFKDVQTEQERWSDLTPAERNAEIRQREAEAQASKERASREDYEARLKELDDRQRAADEKAFEAKLHPSFDRYRFSGKLGDSVAEHRLDQAIWDQTMNSLQTYIDKDVDITQAMIDKEFRKASSELSSIINKQVDKKAKVAVQKAKTAAQSKAQATVSKGLETNQSTQEFQKNIHTGNIRDALAAVLSGKVKLK